MDVCCEEERGLRHCQGSALDVTKIRGPTQWLLIADF